MMALLESLKKYVAADAHHAARTVKRYQARLEGPPERIQDVLDSSDILFEAAATLKVADLVSTAKTLETVQEHAKERVCSGALYPRKSTSTTSNLAHQCETGAWARVLEFIEGGLQT